MTKWHRSYIIYLREIRMWKKPFPLLFSSRGLSFRSPLLKLMLAWSLESRCVQYWDDREMLRNWRSHTRTLEKIICCICTRHVLHCYTLTCKSHTYIWNILKYMNIPLTLAYDACMCINMWCPWCGHLPERVTSIGSLLCPGHRVDLHRACGDAANAHTECDSGCEGYSMLSLAGVLLDGWVDVTFIFPDWITLVVFYWTGLSQKWIMNHVPNFYEAGTGPNSGRCPEAAMLSDPFCWVSHRASRLDFQVQMKKNWEVALATAWTDAHLSWSS